MNVLKSPSLALSRGFPSLTRNIAQTSKAPRSLISILELSNEELSSLVERAAYHKTLYKSEKGTSQVSSPLLGKVAALLFTKRSTRTRISSEGAASYFGAHPMFLGKDDIQLGVNESFYDTTKVISSMTSCIFARVDKHSQIQELAQHSSVPILNSLCDRFHPLQAITDILTIREAFGYTKGLKLAWIGDANNVINDLAIAAIRSGISVSIAIPEGIEMDEEIISKGQQIAQETGTTLEVTHDPKEAVKGANVLVTDTFVSMGQEAESKAKLAQFQGFQISKELASGAAPDWKFMHCLPRHQEEVTDEVFYSDRSLVFPEAENRLYAAIAAVEGFVLNKGRLV